MKKRRNVRQKPLRAEGQKPLRAEGQDAQVLYTCASQMTLRCFWGIPKPLDFKLKKITKHEQKKKKFNRFLA